VGRATQNSTQDLRLPVRRRDDRRDRRCGNVPRRGPARFSSIPISVYWAVVTQTTVGDGDISPHTPLGRFLATFVMLMGYGIIAVPTGIVTAEMSRRTDGPVTTQAGRGCGAEGHDHDAVFCRKCGARL